MKKISTVVAKQSKNFREQKLTIGLDLGDRWSWYCVLDEAGEVLLEQKLGTTPKGGWPRLSRPFYSQGCPVQALLGRGFPWVDASFALYRNDG